VDERIAPSLPDNGDRDPEERSLGNFVLVAIRAIVRVSFEVFFNFAVLLSVSLLVTVDNYISLSLPLGASARNQNGGRGNKLYRSRKWGVLLKCPWLFTFISVIDPFRCRGDP
jgi:hypothetical protein